MNTSINNIIEPNEKIFWQGVINRKVLIFFLITQLIICSISGFLVFKYFDVIRFSFNGKPIEISSLVTGWVVILLGWLSIFISFFSELVKEYAVTHKRIIKKSGLIGADYSSIYFDQIKNIIVDVNLLGKIFKVGSVKIDTGKTDTHTTGGGGQTSSGNYQQLRLVTTVMYDVLAYIDQPYDVYKYLQKALEGRKESLYSGRADRESNPGAYNQDESFDKNSYR
jgi:hypothetical protein